MTLNQKISMGIVALWSAAAFALPSQQAVEAAVKAGNYPQAESMMQEVVAAKPQSAKAHYIYAEILAHDAKFDEAARQAREARTIDPAIGFTDPAKFRSFEQTLQREQAPAQARNPAAAPTAVAQYGASPYQQPASGGIPGWVWGVGIAFVAFLVWRSVTRRATLAQNVVPAGAGYGGPAGYGQAGYGGQPGYGGGYGAPMGQAPGGGMLRTGLAAAGGLAAGVLAEKYFEGQREHERDGNFGGGSNYVDNGSAQAASELESRPIDFGNGDGWGGGDSSGDIGGGGSSDDGGW